MNLFNQDQTSPAQIYRYGYFRSMLKRPLLISLTLHAVFVLAAILHTDPEQEVQILEIQITNAEIIDDTKNEPDPATPQQTEETNEENINSQLEAESLSFNRRDNTPTEDRLQRSDQFVHEYEETLFQRGESKHTVSQTKGARTEWQEEEFVIGHAEKTGSAERVKIPGGATDSSAIQWEGSYARKIVHRPQIDYPRHFRRQGIQGTVVLGLSVNPAGEVIHVEILQSSGHFKLDVLAQKAMRKARFSPRSGGDTKSVDNGKVRIYFELAR